MYGFRTFFTVTKLKLSLKRLRSKERMLVASAYRISIIEDDESLRSALVGLMQSMGHDAYGYESAEAFLDDEGGADDFIITDIQLPGINGITLIRRLRALGRKMPVAVITARQEPALERQAIDASALCVLKKPFDALELVAIMELALNRTRG